VVRPAAAAERHDEASTTGSSDGSSGAGSGGIGAAGVDKDNKRHRHSFYYFNPEDPEHVVEVQAAGAPDKGAIAAAVAAGGSQPGTALAAADPNATAALAKSSAMQAELVAQLDAERRKNKELAQYESMYREWRVRATSATAEVSQLRRVLSEKDSELAMAYERLEHAALERAALHKMSLALESEAESLKAIVEEVEERLLGGQKAGAYAGALGAGNSMSEEDDDADEEEQDSSEAAGGDGMYRSAATASRQQPQQGAQPAAAGFASNNGAKGYQQ